MLQSNKPKLNILVSYAYWQDRIIANLEESVDVKLFIDSGAFTAWKQGKEIKLNDYCAFLKDIPVKPWNYFVLDVVGDSEKTMRNYLEMMEKGFKPIPIFTRGSDIKDIETYGETSKIIGIGGVAGTSKSLNYLEWLHLRIPNDIKLHWLGVTQSAMIVRHKPYSADSSSWSQTGRFGTLRIYLGKGRWKNTSRNQLKTVAPNPAVKKALESYSSNWADLQKESSWLNSSRNLAGLISTQSWLRFSKEIEEKTGTKIFAATCNIEESDNLKDAAYYENN